MNSPWGMLGCLSENCFSCQSCPKTHMLGDAEQDSIDTTTGEKALQYFFNKAQGYDNNGLPLSWQEFHDFILAKSPAFFIGLGGAINAIELSDSKVQATMEKLADTGQGRLPQNLTIFFSAVGQAGSNPSFWDAIPFVTVEVAKEAVTAIAKEGDALIQSGKGIVFLSKYIPLILLLGGGFFIYTYATNLSGGHKGKIKELGDRAKAKFHKVKSAIGARP